MNKTINNNSHLDQDFFNLLEDDKKLLSIFKKLNKKIILNELNIEDNLNAFYSSDLKNLKLYIKFHKSINIESDIEKLINKINFNFKIIWNDGYSNIKKLISNIPYNDEIYNNTINEFILFFSNELKSLLCNFIIPNLLSHFKNKINIEEYLDNNNLYFLKFEKLISDKMSSIFFIFYKNSKLELNKINKINNQILDFNKYKHKNINYEDALKIFNVHRFTDKNEIKKIYHKLCKEYHPDNSKIKNEYVIIIINRAYEILVLGKG